MNPEQEIKFEKLEVKFGKMEEESLLLRSEFTLLTESLYQHQHNGIDQTQKLKNPVPISVELQGAAPVTSANYGTFFINHSERRYIVREINAVWGTASTSGTLQVQRLQGTEAKASGDDLLSSTIDMSGTANTVNIGTLITDGTLLTIEKGDRLGLENGGTLTSQADLCVTVYLEII